MGSNLRARLQILTLFIGAGLLWFNLSRFGGLTETASEKAAVQDVQRRPAQAVSEAPATSLSGGIIAPDTGRIMSERELELARAHERARQHRRRPRPMPKGEGDVFAIQGHEWRLRNDLVAVSAVVRDTRLPMDRLQGQFANHYLFAPEDVPNDLVGQHVLQRENNGRLAIMSGEIRLIFKEQMDLFTLEQDYAVSITSTMAHIKAASVRPLSPRDLHTLWQSLKKDPRFSHVYLELLEAPRNVR